MSEVSDSGRRVAQALAASGGRTHAAAELLPLVYDHLRGIAAGQLAKRGAGHTLQATALVHEAWMRVAGESDPGWDCRAHFFGAAAQAMRDILVEAARKKSRVKHGGGWKRVRRPVLTTPDPIVSPDELLSLDTALTGLEQENAVQAQVVMLRFFTGLSMNEIARLLGLPAKRVEREWRFARAWLQREMREREPAVGAEG